jgi:hypothetical protein
MWLCGNVVDEGLCGFVAVSLQVVGGPVIATTLRSLFYIWI